MLLDLEDGDSDLPVISWTDSFVNNHHGVWKKKKSGGGGGGCHVLWQKRHCSGICLVCMTAHLSSILTRNICTVCTFVELASGWISGFADHDRAGILYGSIPSTWTIFWKYRRFCIRHSLSTYFYPGSRSESHSLRTFSMLVACYRCPGRGVTRTDFRSRRSPY